MSDNYIKNVVEAALLAAGRPLQLNEVGQLFEENTRPEAAAIRAALEALEADYGDRGIELKETASGFRIQVRKEMANEVSRLWPERPPKYSRALLETLALIAYRQPITRGEIEAVRGVAVNPNIIKTVIERNWVHVVGTRDVPGRPELLGTTKDFLDYFGLRALDELPPLAELKAMGDVNLQLDLAKPTDGSDDGSGSSGASGAGEGGSTSGTPGDSSVAAAGAAAAVSVAAMAVAASDGAEGSESADVVGTAEAGADVVGSAEVGESAEVIGSAEASESTDVIGSAEVSESAEAIGTTEVSESAELVDSVEALASTEPDEATSAAAEDVAEAASADTAATRHDAITNATVASSDELEANSDVDASADLEASDAVELQAANTATTAVEAHEAAAEELAPLPSEDFVAYEHDPHAVTITHVDVESDPGDVTVEVEALTFVEQQLEAEERAKDASIETGEFEMSELGIHSRPAPVIEAEFEVDDISSAQADEDDAADADDDEELSAGPQSSTELVAAPPRDRDD